MTSSRVARTPGPDERSQASQDVPIWMAAPGTALWRSKKEVERHGKEGPEGCKSWCGLVWFGTSQRGVEECMESKPGGAPNITTERTANKREECAMRCVW